MDKVKRNDPCPCGSGKKFKHCCLAQDVADGDSAKLNPDPAVTIQIADALQYVDDGLEKIACGVLTAVWGLLRLRLNPAMTTLRALEPVMPEDTPPEDLVFDYVVQLDNASVYDREFGTTGVEFCEYFLRQFTDENPHHIENVRGALGQFHFRAGDPARGEEALRALIADQPHRSIGYAFLSDALGFHRYEWNGSRSLDPVRAVAVLEEAVAAGVEDAADYDLPARLNDMRREAGKV